MLSLWFFLPYLNKSLKLYFFFHYSFIFTFNLLFFIIVVYCLLFSFIFIVVTCKFIDPFRFNLTTIVDIISIWCFYYLIIDNPLRHDHTQNRTGMNQKSFLGSYIKIGSITLNLSYISEICTKNTPLNSFMDITRWFYLIEFFSLWIWIFCELIFHPLNFCLKSVEFLYLWC